MLEIGFLKMRLYLKKLIFVCFASVCLLSSSANAGDWFLHKFGELRSYHGDWLNVCSDSGRGQCRSVQIPLKAGDDPFFGASRLAVIRVEPGTYAIEVYIAGMPDNISSPVIFNFGNEQIKLTDDQWRKGALSATNVAEMLTLEDDAITGRLVDLIRERNTLSISYRMGGNEIGGAKFSLRGSAKALNAIERHIEQL